MEGQSDQGKFARIVAATAIRMQISPQDVRGMNWIDFREVLRLFGVTVRKTPDELSQELERFFRHGEDNRNGNGRG